MENSEKKERSDGNVIALCLALSAAIFLLDSYLELGVAGGVPYILVVLVSLWSPRKRLPIYMAILGSVLTVAGFYSSLLGGEMWKAVLNRGIALFAIWTTAVLSVQRENLLKQREEALLKVRVLSGLLPICASCKKIRDDKGYWNQIEGYIRDHSEAEFSHGLCPDCAKKLYPDIDFGKRNR